MSSKNKNKDTLPYHSMPGIGSSFMCVNGLAKSSNDGRRIEVSEVEHNKDILYISCAKQHENGNTYELKFVISKDGAKQPWDLLGSKLFGGK